MDTITTPRPFIFVLMPFSEDFTDTYQLGIKPACEEAGAYCERVDEQVFQDSILQRIYNQIAKADFIVADMTGRNPNVFYEVGYAHALGKKVILLTKDSGDIPFDLKHYPHIVYEGRIVQLKHDLKTKVRYFIDHPDESSLRTAQDLEFYSVGHLLRNGETLWAEGSMHSTGLTFDEVELRVSATLAVHNSTSRSISRKQYRLALISKAIARLSRLGGPFVPGILQPDGSRFFQLPSFGADLFPDEWTSIKWRMVIFEPQPDKWFQAVLRVYTDLGRSDYPIRIEYRMV